MTFQKKGKKSAGFVPVDIIQNKILLIRGKKVMPDQDLASLYCVPTKRLNEQVKRNLKRFPSDFCFQLTARESINLKSQIATSSWGGKRKMPFVFTEQGVAMMRSLLLYLERSNSSLNRHPKNPKQGSDLKC